jgi:predicted AlkP superfamily phosphohydrolase/phosphomutase/Tfp pilus assembly protein PilF
MFRSRALSFLVLVLAMAAVMYLLVSLFLPSSRRLIFGVDKHSGTVRMVGQSITFLPPHQFYRLSFDKRQGSAQGDGFISITSREKVPVRVAYRLRFGIADGKIPDAQRLVREGWSAWIRARVTEAVSAVASQIPLEELVSPTSEFNSRRDRLRQVVARHLAQSGLNVTAFEIARLDVDRDALLRSKRVDLRRDTRSVPSRVAIFAIDGADWDLLSELSNDKRIPNIEALVKNGTTASVQTIQPTVSPLLWTSVATGLAPDRHGVIDFFDRERGNAPVDSYSRHVPALWDIAEAFGRPSLTVDWWTAWPATSPEAFVFDTPAENLPTALQPSSLSSRVNGEVVPEATVGVNQIQRFLNITSAEYQHSVSVAQPNDPIAVFRSLLAKTWTDHRVAFDLFNARKPLLTMVQYEGTDAVNHLFGPFHPPMREGVSSDDYRRYWPTVSNYYAEVDRLIGEWMAALPPDTTVILMSAHGMKWGKDRPRKPPTGATALSDHRNPGVLIAYGNHIAPSRLHHSMSVYDVAPTVLALLGLPVAREMPGKFQGWMFKDVQPIEGVTVVSYSEFVSSRPIPTSVTINPQQYKAELLAIGHVSDPSRNLAPVLEDESKTAQVTPVPPQNWGLYAYYNNLGVELKRQGKSKEAIEAFQKAIEINPSSPTPYLNMSMAMFDKQQYSAAEEAFLNAVAHGLPNAERYFVDFAALYRENHLISRAIALLQKGKSLFPQSYEIAANLGSALVEGDRITEGQPELERALGLEPSSTMVLNNLGILYAQKKDYGRALDYWNRSLSVEPHQPQIREAVVAVQSRL